MFGGIYHSGEFWFSPFPNPFLSFATLRNGNHLDTKDIKELHGWCNMLQEKQKAPKITVKQH